MPMKRLLCFIITITLVLSMGFYAYADDNYIVNVEDVKTKQGEMITIPVHLKNNKGIMGFRITIKYPKNQLTLTDVSSGSITADGLFNTTITDYYSVNGRFDVVWSQNAEVKDDGTLFVMTYKVKGTADDGKYNISVTYSQEDTFNEKFDDVNLSCSPIQVFIGDVTSPVTEQEKTTKASDGKNDDKPVSDDYLVSSTEQIIQSFGQSDIESLTEEQQKTVVEYVNNRVDSYGGGKKYDSFDELKSDYKEATKREAARKVIESTNLDKIVSVTDEVLKEYGVNSFGDLPADKKQEAVEKTLQKLAEEGADEDGFNHLGSVDDAAESLDNVVKTAREEKDKTISPSEERDKIKKDNSKLIIIIVACFGGLAVIIFVVILVKKRRKRNEK